MLDLFSDPAPAVPPPAAVLPKPTPKPAAPSAKPAMEPAPAWQSAGSLDVHFLAFVATCRGWGVASRVVDPSTGKGDPVRARRWANFLLRGIESDRPASFDAARWAAAIAALPRLFAHLVEQPIETWKGAE